MRQTSSSWAPFWPFPVVNWAEVAKLFSAFGLYHITCPTKNWDAPIWFVLVWDCDMEMGERMRKYGDLPGMVKYACSTHSALTIRDLYSSCTFKKNLFWGGWYFSTFQNKYSDPLSAFKYELDKFPFTVAQHVVNSGKCWLMGLMHSKASQHTQRVDRWG